MRIEKKYIGENKELVYSKFSFRQFWHFINIDEDYIYEIRMKGQFGDKKYHPKILGKYLKVPYHWTGVFIYKLKDFEKTCIYGIKNGLTMYLSINPKRRSYHGDDNLEFETYNGKLQSELGYYNILFDFDPTKLCKKDFPNHDEICYRKAKEFLKNNPNIKKYIMIGSGNGIQLRVPLDTSILFPKINYDAHKQIIIDEELETYFKLMKFSLIGLTKKYSDKYVIIDSTSLEVARVGRLPFSFNWKRGNKKPCGIIEIVDEGENKGLHDVIMSNFDRLRLYQEKKKLYKDKELAKEFTYTKDNIQDSALVKLMTQRELPGGGRNNILFFQFKLLCHQNGIDLKDPKIKDIVRKMQRVQKENYPINSVIGTFHPEAIINYCVEQRIKPIYEVLYFKDRKRNIDWDILMVLKKEAIENTERVINLPDAKNTIKRIISYCRNYVKTWTNPMIMKIEIGNLMIAIKTEYGIDGLNYFTNSGVLKTILEKI